MPENTNNNQPLDLNQDADQIIAMVEAHRADTNPDAQLATLQVQASEVADPAPSLETIRGALVFIEDQNQDLIPALDDIWSAVQELTDSNNKLRQTTAAATALAAEFRQQRETVLKTLQDLRQAIENADWREPSIEMLMESLEEQWIEMMEYGGLDDMVLDNIVAQSPLTHDQAITLYRTITGGTLIEETDDIWESLKTWIIAAKEATESAFEAWRQSRE